MPTLRIPLQLRLTVLAAALCQVLALAVPQPASAADSPSGKPALESPYDLVTFERFLRRCKRERVPYKLSLRQLAEDCTLAERSGGRLSTDLRYLHGFTWFFGYAVDQEAGDVVLLGYRDPNRPPVDIDCLVTAIRSAFTGRMPSCSLDAHPDPRYQKSVVNGVDWRTRWAEIMIEADYDMKKICQGQVDPGISSLFSWTDMRVSRFIQTGQGDRQENRWWFNRPKKDVPRTLLLDDAGALVVIYRNPVVLMTEQNIDGRYGTGAQAIEAKKFAESFTRDIELLGRRFRSIGELLTLYRLLDLMVHLKQVSRVFPPLDEYWLREYHSPCAGPAEGMPTLTRTVKRQNGDTEYTSTVRGGVRMPLDLDRNQIRTDTAPKGLRRSVLDGP